jgi:hypothetical protein
MKKQCAYCDKDMGYLPGQPGTESDTTHGICPECYAEQIEIHRQNKGLSNQVTRQAQTILTLSERLRANGLPCEVAPPEKQKAEEEK